MQKAKKLAIFLLMGLLCSLAVLPVTASATGVLTVKVGEVVVVPGTTTVQVSITVENVTEITSFGLAVSYDDTKMTFVEGIQGSIVPSTNGMFIAAKRPGVSVVSVGFLGSGANPISSDGVLATLTFELTGAPLGTIVSLPVSHLDFVDVACAAIPAVVIDGEIKISKN